METEGQEAENLPEVHSPSKKTTPKQPEIDHILEDLAKKKNLSVLNVKSILRHVLKDKRVLYLAQKKAAEGEGNVAGQHQWEEEIAPFEPKLTRSRVRQELMSPEKIANLTNIIKLRMPIKKGWMAVKERGVTGLYGESMAGENSSDDEYNPDVESGTEESDDQSIMTTDEEDLEDEEEEDDDNGDKNGEVSHVAVEGRGDDDKEEEDMDVVREDARPKESDKTTWQDVEMKEDVVVSRSDDFELMLTSTETMADVDDDDGGGTFSSLSLVLSTNVLSTRNSSSEMLRKEEKGVVSVSGLTGCTSTAEEDVGTTEDKGVMICEPDSDPRTISVGPPFQVQHSRPEQLSVTLQDSLTTSPPSHLATSSSVSMGLPLPCSHGQLNEASTLSSTSSMCASAASTLVTGTHTTSSTPHSSTSSTCASAASTLVTGTHTTSSTPHSSTSSTCASAASTLVTGTHTTSSTPHSSTSSTCASAASTLVTGTHTTSSTPHSSTSSTCASAASTLGAHTTSPIDSSLTCAVLITSTSALTPGMFTAPALTTGTFCTSTAPALPMGTSSAPVTSATSRSVPPSNTVALSDSSASSTTCIALPISTPLSTSAAEVPLSRICSLSTSFSHPSEPVSGPLVPSYPYPPSSKPTSSYLDSSPLSVPRPCISSSLISSPPPSSYLDSSPLSVPRPCISSSLISSPPPTSCYLDSSPISVPRPCISSSLISSPPTSCYLDSSPLSVPRPCISSSLISSPPPTSCYLDSSPLSVPRPCISSSLISPLQSPPPPTSNYLDSSPLSVPRPCISSSLTSPLHSPPPTSSELSCSSPILPPDDNLIHETAALLVSLSNLIQNSQSPVKPSMMDHQPPSLLLSREGEIADRTRSKLPLIDTSISLLESMLDLPDLDEPRSPLEPAEDEMEWQKWLGDLFDPSTPTNANDSVVREEDGDDVEYNYLNDEVDYEKEEFRNDKAVKISKKEVDELLNEYLYPSASGVSGLISTDGMDLTSAYLLQSIGLQTLLLKKSATGTHSHGHTSFSPTKSALPTGLSASRGHVDDEVCLTYDQTAQLHTQIQQYYQLLMQTFVLARFEPTLVHISQMAAQAVNELHQLKLDAMESKSDVQVDLWTIPHHQEGLDLIQSLDPHKDDSIMLIAASGNPARITDVAQNILMSYRIFWEFPHLLPGIGFGSLSKDKQPNSNYTPEEDYLLVMGMDHYGTNAWGEIQQNVLPIKTPKQLKLRVKNACAKRSSDNVIKHFKKNKEVKIPFKSKGKKDQMELRESIEKTHYQTGSWPSVPLLQTYHKKRVEREKKEVKRKDRTQEQGSKLKKITSPCTSELVVIPGKLSGKELALAASSSKQDSARLSTPVLSGKPDLGRAGLSWLSSTPPSSSSNNKRNLTTTAVATPKRLKLSDNEQEGIGGYFGGEGPQTDVSTEAVSTGSLTKVSMELLLHAAGLEASSSSAKYAYRYLGEVKSSLLGEDGMQKYDLFLNILVRASKENMAPSKIYSEVKKILHPWPHLVQLFTEFLGPEDCIRADAMPEKCELESVKLFISQLEDKFKDSPVKIDEILTTLLSLDVPGVTRQQVVNKLQPLIEAHEDLVGKLKQFVYQLAPPTRPSDVYEEISLLGSDNEREWDRFEEMDCIDTSINMNKSGMANDAAKPVNTGPRPPLSHTPASSNPSAASASSSTPSFPSKLLKKSHKSQASYLALTETPSSSGQPTQPHNLQAVPCKKAKTGNTGLLRTSWQKPPHVQVQRRPMNSTVDSNTAITQRRMPPRTRTHHARKVQQPVKGEWWNSSSVILTPSETPSSEDDPLKCTSVTEEFVCERPESLCESLSGKVMFGLRRESNTLELSPVAEASPPSEAQNSHEQTPYRHTSDKCPSLMKEMDGPIQRLLSITPTTDVLEAPTPVQSSILERTPQVAPSFDQGGTCLATRSLELTPLVTNTHDTLKSLPSPVTLQGSPVTLQGSQVTLQGSQSEVVAEGSNHNACDRDVPANKWTREEDKVILKKCLHARLKLSEDSDSFKEVAVQLHRGTEEVRLRYEELFELFQSRKAKLSCSHES